MIKVLVTGATGYIGSHVCKFLKRNNCHVIGVDRVSRPHTIKHMDQLLVADYDSAETYETLKNEDIDVIVHCAGTSLVGPSMVNPMEYYTNNVAKTANFFNQLRWLPRVPGVVFSSSASVYGSPDVDSITEDQPWNPMSPYGQSKAMIELMLVDLAHGHGIQSVSLRYFNACGADIRDHELGQAPGATHIIARLLEAHQNNTEFTLFGNDFTTQDGTCVRDYIHVDDLASAHWAAVAYLLAGGSSIQLNLGTGVGYSNQQVIDAVEHNVGTVKVKISDRRPGDPKRLIANSQLAQNVLEWKPAHSDLDTIIQSAWKWYNNPSNLVDK